MKNLSKIVVGMLAFVSVALALGPDPFDYKVADFAIMQSKAVQKNMGITEAQRTQMNKYADQNRKEVNAELAALQKVHKQPDATLGKRSYEELKRNVLAVLTPKQLKRLREITLQRAGPMGLLNQDLARRIGMSEADLAKYRKYYVDGAKQASAIAQRVTAPINAKYKGVKPKDSADAQRIQQKYNQEVGAAMSKVSGQIEAIRRDTKKKMLALVTPKENAIWQTLMGPKFTG